MKRWEQELYMDYFFSEILSYRMNKWNFFCSKSLWRRFYKQRHEYKQWLQRWVVGRQSYIKKREMIILFLSDLNLKMLLVGLSQRYTLTMEVYGNKCSKSSRNFHAVASDPPFFDFQWTLDEKETWSRQL